MADELIGFIYGTSTTVQDSPDFTSIPLEQSDTDAHSAASPVAAFRLGRMQVHVSAIAGGAATLTWYLSEDAAGLVGITSIYTSTIQKRAAGNSTGWVSQSLSDVPHQETDEDGVRGTLYFHAYTDVGSCDVQPSLVWSRRR